MAAQISDANMLSELAENDIANLLESETNPQDCEDSEPVLQAAEQGEAFCKIRGFFCGASIAVAHPSTSGPCH